MDKILGFNEVLNGAIYDLSASTGIPADQSKYVLCLLLAYPLGFVFSYLPNNPTMKHIIGLVIGLWFGWFTMGWQLINSFVSSLVTYLILAFLPRHLSYKIVWVWAMGYLSVSHLYRMYVDYMGWSMDFTGPQMLLTIKLTTFAYDYLDGSKSEEKLNSHQKAMRVTTLPSPLEFFAYVYFFCGFLAGPAFNLKEYLDYINGDLFKDAPKGRMPSAILPALNKLFHTVLILVGIFANMTYPLAWCRTEDFLALPFLSRLGYVWFAGALSRFPYYFAWTLSEGSCNLAGIGYTKMEQGKPVWDRATNCRVWDLEMAQNFKGVTEAWNIRTDRWLKHYVYERVKVAPLALTFLCSAMWHGFYPGYYFSFMSSSFVIQNMRIIRRNIRSRCVEADGVTPKPIKVVYDAICLVATHFTLNYMMTPFVLLGFEYSWKVWLSLFFIGHWMNVGVFIFAQILGPPKRKTA